MIVGQGVPKPTRPSLRGTLSTYPALEAFFARTSPRSVTTAQVRR